MGNVAKSFPKGIGFESNGSFCEVTHLPEEGTCEYARPNNGRSIVKNRKHVHNGYIVPYNPYLLVKYDCHINVEICSTTMAVKYLYKYMNKGSDRMATNFEGDVVDEIKNHLDSRYITPPEACWRIFGFGLHENSHTVERLPIHLENQQSVTFREGAEIDELEGVLESASTTKLTAYFNLCSTDNFAANLLYHEVPEHYTWDQRGKCGQDRLKFLQFNQKKIRAELYQGLEDHINANDGERVGRKSILPSSYIGGPRHMSALYQDAMAVVRRHGKPDLSLQ